MSDTPMVLDLPATGGFRASMNWLHTWAGVVIGSVLFAMFWMGTLSVFDREVDRWMMPMTRLAPGEGIALDTLKPIAGRIASDAEQWSAVMPNDRVPTIQLSVYDQKRGIDLRRDIDPATGTLLPDAGTLGGTGFFYPFHFMLRTEPSWIGEWLAGIAAMTMLVLCISGVVVHKRIFADFFTLRIVRKPQRTTLDLHNVTGVLGLPFNFMMALSGLIIFMSIYMPTPQRLAYHGDEQAFGIEAYGQFERKPVGRPGALGSLNGMQAEAMRRWKGERPYFVRVWHPGDAAGYVEMRRPYDRGVVMRAEAIYFDAATGAVLKTTATGPIMTAQSFLSGMHFIQFRHWTLRWLYFLSGLGGCGLIATGFLFWVQSRRKRHAKLGLKGVAIVEGLAIGATTGIIIATCAFLIANRLLPLGLDGRAGLETWTFYVAWVAAFAHAWLRRGTAWAEQAWTIAAGAMAAALLDAATTGDTIWAAAARGQWAVAGMDLVLLSGGAVAMAAALRLQSRIARTSHRLTVALTAE